MDISILVRWGIGTTAGYDPDSMNARTIDNYMVVGTFGFGEAIAEDRWTARVMDKISAIRASFLVRHDSTWARLPCMAQVDDYVCLAQPSRLKKRAGPMFNSMVRQ
jgi:hypothetical protein